MLLVSAVTPSAREWVLESAVSTVPTARVVDLARMTSTSTSAREGGWLRGFGLTGAQFTSTDLLTGLSSLRRVSDLVALWNDVRNEHSDVIVWCDRSVAEIASDLHALTLLAQAAGTVDAAQEALRSLEPLLEALTDGRIQWMLGCPPQPDALQQARIEIAAGAGVGVPIRGVLVAPMPRKRDGWPAELRAQAQNEFEALAMDLHPVPVLRSRSGRAPVFDHPAVSAAEASTVIDARGDRVMTVTLPGIAACGADNVRVGTWSVDPAYPITHLLIEFDRFTVRYPVDSVVRRCRAVDAVIADDTVAVSFIPEDGQWPAEHDRGGER